MNCKNSHFIVMQSKKTKKAFNLILTLGVLQKQMKAQKQK